MKVVNSLKNLKPLIDGRQVYVRYSNGPAKDKKYGCSRDHQSGSFHDGLSAVSIPADADDETILSAITEYIYLKVGTRSYGWIFTATENGKDSDGHPTVDADTVTPIAKIDSDWADKIVKWNIALADYRQEVRRAPAVDMERIFQTRPSIGNFDL